MVTNLTVQLPIKQFNTCHDVTIIGLTRHERRPLFRVAILLIPCGYDVTATNKMVSMV